MSTTPTIYGELKYQHEHVVQYAHNNDQRRRCGHRNKRGTRLPKHSKISEGGAATGETEGGASTVRPRPVSTAQLVKSTGTLGTTQQWPVSESHTAQDGREGAASLDRGMHGNLLRSNTDNGLHDRDVGRITGDGNKRDVGRITGDENDGDAGRTTHGNVRVRDAEGTTHDELCVLGCVTHESFSNDTRAKFVTCYTGTTTGSTARPLLVAPTG